MLPYQPPESAADLRFLAPLLDVHAGAHRARDWQAPVRDPTEFPRFALRLKGAQLTLGLRTAGPRRPAAELPPAIDLVNPTPARFRFRGLVRTTASVVAAAGLLAAAPLAAQDPQPQERVHVVQPGETLWDIARAYLNDPFLWPEIFRLNADVVEDPARIYPRERLVIPGAGEAGPYEPSFVMRPGQEGGPRILGVRERERPAVLQGDFYRAAFIARPEEVPLVGRFVEPEYQSVVPQRMPSQVNLYDRLFVRVDPAAVNVGDRLHFLREGRRMRGLGRVYQPTGLVTVAAMEGEIATVVLIGMFDQVNVGDVAVPVAAFPLRNQVFPAEVEADLQGRILAFQDESPLQRTESILFLDIGRRAGVAVGDEFEAYDPPTERRWGTRPEVPVARMQVVRVMEGTASVRVVELDQPRIAVGLPVRRVARMP